ncbi:hypothetical protein [Acutalibacter sp. 1XD8-36]|uniref:hypothetical protein n=1 Tax=Acutalibacter sp. 1XD8-36 TaxID=2320852 RepID=UPI001412A8D4|nr:hypothetical protein [Acutalibacter sp. 1XD8-36]NBJ88635.1 hypothetical protein [Acutalibacter sp. 1XD8-36]
MWNCDWEYENQETLEQWYEEKISGAKPDSAVRKIICKGCGRVFYTQIASMKYCNYGLCGNRGYQKDLKQRRLEKRQNQVCKSCGKVFTPKRSDALYCCSACRQRAYSRSVTDSQGAKMTSYRNRNGKAKVPERNTLWDFYILSRSMKFFMDRFSPIIVLICVYMFVIALIFVSDLVHHLQERYARFSRR